MTLPLILAGPVLRRADENQVYVWLVTSFDPVAGLELEILDVSDPKSESSIQATSELKTVRAGENVYISLVGAYPDARPPLDAKFPKDTLLAYDLWFVRDQPGGATEKVSLSQLIETPYDELRFKGETLKPTFYLQGDIDLVLLHGSCRKPHGSGKDAFAAADTLIGTNPRDLRSRPCLVCLTGDQIYANGIHRDTLKQIHRVAKDLFGYDEHVPTGSGLRSLKDLADVSRGSKRSALAKKAGLSADAWPLFGLTEMLIMYFLSWHTSLWDSFSPVTKLRGVTNVTEVAGLQEIKNFIAGLPAVMRALANAPTYMIFDDHEVTDDWNLHKDWNRKVHKSDLGRRMVTNALVAYWLCQGWGNDPSRFNSTFEKALKDYCELLRSSKGKVSAKASASCDKLFWEDFHDWGFVTPTRPPVFVLDTRTDRELYRSGRAPKLLSTRAWDSFLAESDVKGTAGSGSKAGKVTMQPGDPLLVVAPTPVFGMLFTEAKDKQDFLADGPEGPDFEHWRFNQGAHHEFLKGLITHFDPSYCVFLSGDVHASFSAEVDYMLKPSAIPADIAAVPTASDLNSATRFYQFTSSPLKNENHELGAQVDAASSKYASEILSAFYGIEMWATWDLAGYDKTWRDKVAASVEWPTSLVDIYDLLYVQLMDGLKPHDPFVTMSAVVAAKLQALKMGQPLWRETGKYFRHFRKNSDDAPFYPYNNIGLVTITRREITHELCSVKKVDRLMPTLYRYPYKSTLPR